MKFTKGQEVIIVREDSEYYGWKGEIQKVNYSSELEGCNIYSVDVINPNKSGSDNWDVFEENELVDLSRG